MFIEIALDDFGDLFIVGARTALGALLLVPVALKRGAFATVRPVFGWLVLTALVNILGPFVLITAGQHHVTSSMAGILVASAPIFIAIITSFAAKDERLQPIGIVGVVIGIVGIVLLFGVDLGSDSDAILGGLGILLAGLGYAIGSLIAKRKLQSVPPVGVAASLMGLSALFLLPALPWTAPSDTPSLGSVAALVALGAGGTGIAFLIYYTLNADVGPSRASIVAYIAPVFSVFYGVTLLDEHFTIATAAGLMLILGGSWLAADGRLPGAITRRRSIALAPGHRGP
jgi:drug/metabolite transporter (DMT)-like permease